MEQSIEIKIPRQWLAGIPDEPMVLEQIFRLGLYQYRVTRALSLYQDGVGSLGYVAEQMKLPKRDLIREARLRGIEPELIHESAGEDLE